MRDRRRTPFFYLTVGASRTLRHHFPIERGGRTTALAVYAVMCELANEQRGREFTATRAVIAEYAGVGLRTLDTYGERLIQAGLIEREHRSEGGLHLPNGWALIDVADPADEPSADPSREAILDVRGGGATSAPLAQPVRQWRSGCAGVAQPVRQGGAASAPPSLTHARETSEEVKEEGEEPPLTPQLSLGGDDHIEILGPRLTPWPASGRRRDHEAIVEARRVELEAWLAEHPASADLQELVAPGLRAVADRVDESTAAIWIEPMHAHQVTEQGVALGTRPELADWSVRYGPLLQSTLGMHVVLFGCPCPGYTFATVTTSEAVA